VVQEKNRYGGWAREAGSRKSSRYANNAVLRANLRNVPHIRFAFSLSLCGIHPALSAGGFFRSAWMRFYLSIQDGGQRRDRTAEAGLLRALPMDLSGLESADAITDCEALS
jgi:hypothetical protein